MMRRVLLTVFIIPCIHSVLSNVTIRVPGDVVAGRPFTLECRLIRPTNGNASYLIWTRHVGSLRPRIYISVECNSSIPLAPSSPAGLSGGCQHVNGEEVYTVTIENVTEDMGQGIWRCQYIQSDNVTLDVKVMVTRVTLTNSPDAVLAGESINFTCVTSASKPQACIRGYIRSSGNVRELGPPADCNQNSSAVQTTTRTLTFTASAEDNGAELYCNASNSVTDPPVRSQIYTLNVQHPPQNGVLLSGYVNNTPIGRNLNGFTYSFVPIGLLVGIISGAIVLLVLVLTGVVILLRRRTGQRSGEKEHVSPDDVSSGGQSARHYENIRGNLPSGNEHTTPSFACHTGACEDLDVLPSSSNSCSGVPTELYSVVNKKKKGPPVYTPVNKPSKASKPAKEQEGLAYTEGNKAKKTNKIAKGHGPVDTYANTAFDEYEVMHSKSGDGDHLENPSRPGQRGGSHKLAYTDVDFVDTKPTIHPAKHPTSYASIAFGQVGPTVQADTDDEWDGHP